MTVPTSQRATRVAEHCSSTCTRRCLIDIDRDPTYQYFGLTIQLTLRSKMKNNIVPKKKFLVFKTETLRTLTVNIATHAPWSGPSFPRSGCPCCVA
jgi:hypothetical protein